MATAFPIAWIARRTIPDVTSIAVLATNGAGFLPRRFFASGLVAERSRARRGAREPVVHRFPFDRPRRRLDDDALGAARIELAQVRVEVVAVARGFGIRRNP